MTNSLFKQ